MILHNLKYAARFIASNKLYSIINLSGLVLGTTFSLIIFLIIFQEISYDRFHQNHREIFQVMKYERTPAGSGISSSLPLSTAGMLDHIADFKSITRILSVPPPPLMIDGEKKDERGIYADSGIFSVFTFNLTRGNLNTALRNPSEILVSESTAEKYFPGEDATGKDLTVAGDQNRIFTISGIFRDVPVNSSLQFDYIIPLQSAAIAGNNDDWIVSAYVRMNSETSPERAAAKLKLLDPGSEDNDDGKESELFVCPFADTHIKPVRYRDAYAGGMTGAITGLSIIGIMMLLIACINYTNLSTALSCKRSRQTGVRKIIGSRAKDLTFQFLLESFLFSVVAIITGLCLANFLIPAFNASFHWNLAADYSNPFLITGIVCLLILTTLLAGIYPAFYLSRLNPLRILNGSGSKGRRNPFLRKMLVIMQFFFATILVVISLTSMKQIRYIRNKDMGVTLDDMIIYRMDDDLIKSSRILKDEILNLPSVEGITFTSGNPLLVFDETREVEYGEFTEKLIPFALLQTDFDFVKTMNLSITTGRDFNPALFSDSLCFLVNQTAASEIDSGSVTGTILTVMKKHGPIIGVFSDYHNTHMNFPIKPLIIGCSDKHLPYVIIKFRQGMAEQGIEMVKKIVKEFDENASVSFTAMRDSFEEIYEENIFRIGRLSAIFSLIALWIASIGLAGLSVFSTEMRTKEIAIHKVHGAHAGTLVRMLIADYVHYVLISFLFSIPVGYMIVNKMFSRTAYHTELTFSIFLGAVMFVLIISVTTVGFRSYRVAQKNPAETLSYE